MTIYDPINPKHYLSHPSGIECIEITRVLPSNRANAVKYLWRCGKKENTPPVVDLEKAIWYLNDEIGNMYPPEYHPETAITLAEKLDALSKYETDDYILLLNRIIFGDNDNLCVAIYTIKDLITGGESC